MKRRNFIGTLLAAFGLSGFVGKVFGKSQESVVKSISNGFRSRLTYAEREALLKQGTRTFYDVEGRLHSVTAGNPITSVVETSYKPDFTGLQSQFLKTASTKGEHTLTVEPYQLEAVSVGDGLIQLR